MSDGGDLTVTGSNLFTITGFKPRCIAFHLGGEMLVEIYPDGTLKFGPNFTTKDEASLELWRLLAEALPAFRAMLLRSDEIR
jgi:hypothetical protein